jgi:sporulation protein YlmC with PRC-barrel domain
VGQFRASKFIGVDIYGVDNQKIGDINEILIDGSGSAKAIVIGVGGFLGIGEKNVAVPFSAVQWVNTPVRSAASGTAGTTAGGGTSTTTGAATTGAGAGTTGAGTATTGATTGGGTAATGGSMATTGGTAATMGSTTAGTGSTTTAGTTTGTAATRPAGAPAATPQRSPDEMAAYNGYPDHGVLRMSKEELQNAPTFRYYAQANTASGATSNVTTTPMTSPAGTPRQ